MTSHNAPNNLHAHNPAIRPRPAVDQRLRRTIMATMAKKSFCTLATTSPAGRAHVAGVVYEMVDGRLWVHASSGSRKALNIAANPYAGVCVPFRRLPVGPPYTIHFQAHVEILAMTATEPQALLGAGKLKSISGHGALDMPDGCFLAITPRARVHSFGPGARVIDLIRDPLHSGARSFELSDDAAEAAMG